MEFFEICLKNLITLTHLWNERTAKVDEFSVKFLCVVKTWNEFQENKNIKTLNYCCIVNTLIDVPEIVVHHNKPRVANLLRFEQINTKFFE